jgi:hypothetical protein
VHGVVIVQLCPNCSGEESVGPSVRQACLLPSHWLRREQARVGAGGGGDRHPTARLLAVTGALGLLGHVTERRECLPQLRERLLTVPPEVLGSGAVRHAIRSRGVCDNPVPQEPCLFILLSLLCQLSVVLEANPGHPACQASSLPLRCSPSPQCDEMKICPFNTCHFN